MDGLNTEFSPTRTTTDSCPLEREMVNYDTNPTRLFQLLTGELWDSATDHLEHDPEEASIWIAKSLDSIQEDEHWEFLPLHIACMSCAENDEGDSDRDTKLILKLIDCYPEAIQMQDYGGDLPLHHALRGGASGKLVCALLLPYPETLELVDSQGKTAMESILLNHQSSINNGEDGVGYDVLHTLLTLKSRTMDQKGNEGTQSFRLAQEEDNIYGGFRLDPSEDVGLSLDPSGDVGLDISSGEVVKAELKKAEENNAVLRISLKNMTRQCKAAQEANEESKKNLESVLTKLNKKTMDVEIGKKMQKTFNNEIKIQAEYTVELEGKLESLNGTHEALKRDNDELNTQYLKKKTLEEQQTPEDYDNLLMMEESFKKQLDDFARLLKNARHSEAKLQEENHYLVKANGRLKMDLAIQNSTVVDVEVEIEALRRTFVSLQTEHAMLLVRVECEQIKDRRDETDDTPSIDKILTRTTNLKSRSSPSPPTHTIVINKGADRIHGSGRELHATDSPKRRSKKTAHNDVYDDEVVLLGTPTSSCRRKSNHKATMHVSSKESGTSRSPPVSSGKSPETNRRVSSKRRTSSKKNLMLETCEI
eukprot:CAMPEP_0198283278 /NCGR_PEP_ID=MMETSP1449-20131203/2929_1 /TAXON_ID=420275 /ORGANISM="Attheya septentrionalis, Strain CCMP2084" /LENGTH=591 /DNA_ID=CAMNT_0043979855 /DNA_START=64 /DNA_END=1839 /DNA_ORIENTATION=+